MTADPTDPRPAGADPIDTVAAAATLRVLANPSRLRIVLHLLQGECSVAQIEARLGLRQPNLSQQLGELREAGLVATRRESKSVIYRLADEAQVRLVSALLHGFGGTAVGVAAPGPEQATRDSKPMTAAGSSYPRDSDHAAAVQRLASAARPRQAAVFAIVGDNT
ncbi:MAG: metalloregulator ArsR/SmtB family transcription factor [Acetobacteraceae bacterium]|nr:metalloregulator ArsR/SmtB family transcription factor [Acetobacteraceae bacterium]